jgi:hypothetical protein
MVSWCSWLSRQSNTLKVPSSNLGEAIFHFFFHYLGEAIFHFFHFHFSFERPKSVHIGWFSH